VGIPAFSVNEGMKFKHHDEAWGHGARRRLREESLSPAERRYHPGMDYTSDAAIARFRIRAGMGGG